ncbi:MAG TPA: alpha-amylase family glycosyl hydrolase, partial [Anaerolineales bacterium]
IGDFNGITEKLDYLQELGIKGLWLMPIHPTPSYHGYHVTDYYAVNPEYGAMEDFRRLLDEAHKRDIKIIIDFVLNHTSDQHPWFQSAIRPGSEYRDWYVWEESDPGTRGPWNQQVWYQGPNGDYYYAVYVREIPDLNYDNRAVREEAKKITAFWLTEVGIDGFRLDGVRYWVEGEKLADSPSNHKFLEEWGKFYRGLDGQAFSVGEAWTDNANVREYTNTDAELDAAFNFDLSTAILKSINENNNASVRFVLQTTVRDFPQQDNANFLTNHDMNRVMSQFGGDEARAKSAAGILLTAPGIPFLYYGEEIGMSGTRTSGAGADIPIRTPMQWSGDEGAGFTEGTPWTAINSDYPEVNVEAQTGEADSLLEHYRKLIQLRNGHPALQTGQTYVAESTSSKLVPYLRASEEEMLLVLINIDDAPVTDYELNLSSGPLTGNYTAASLLDDSTVNPLEVNTTGGFDAYVPLEEIPPYSIFVIQLTAR